MRIGRGIGRTARWLVAAVMAFGVSTAMAQITNTKHNLGSTAGNPGTTKSTGTDEICVFCHTPHAADSFTGAPLWNKRIDMTKTYTIYGTSSSTMDAARATGGMTASPSIGSVSLACLSCHDGAQAMDNILNAPGSGGYAADGGGATGLAWAGWAGNATAAGVMTNAATTLAMLDTDLSNDHPIGIRYCGGGPTTGAMTASCVDADFKAPANNGTAWWVDTEGTPNGTRNKTDMILYTRSFASGTDGPSVECASCHDPHTSNTTFLRIANTGSAVCLACHSK